MHVGTNGYKGENNTGILQKSIANIAKGMVSEKWKILVSVIISWNDEQNNKAVEVNYQVKDYAK